MLPLSAESRLGKSLKPGFTTSSYDNTQTPGRVGLPRSGPAICSSQQVPRTTCSSVCSFYQSTGTGALGPCLYLSVPSLRALTCSPAFSRMMVGGPRMLAVPLLCVLLTCLRLESWQELQEEGASCSVCPPGVSYLPTLSPDILNRDMDKLANIISNISPQAQSSPNRLSRR